jgi:hypothetical protein
MGYVAGDGGDCCVNVVLLSESDCDGGSGGGSSETYSGVPFLEAESALFERLEVWVLATA